ncbi:MAG TPA: DUF6456 domain-containing protein [Rhizomicrobium sp.]
MSAPALGEVEREARRVLRKLGAPGAHLRPDGAGAFRILAREDADKYRSAAIGAALVEAFARRGWIVRAGSAQHYVLSDAGLGWLARAAAPEEPFAAQHQLRRRKFVKDARGQDHRVTVDDAESPLARLKARGLIDAMQFDAGEKLRADFTIAGLSPRLGIDYAAPLETRSRGKRAGRLLTDSVLAAKQRFTQAMRAVGPGLSDLLFDVCCHWRGLEEAEAAKGWPGRSGRVVLGIALDRLAEHYGMKLRGGAKLRGWTMEEEA